MPLFGHMFISEALKRPVFDPKGDVAGRVFDAMVVRGDPLPKISAILVNSRCALPNLSPSPDSDVIPWWRNLDRRGSFGIPPSM